MELVEVGRILKEYYRQEISIPEKDYNLKLTSTFEGKTVPKIVEVINLTLDSEVELEARS